VAKSSTAVGGKRERGGIRERLKQMTGRGLGNSLPIPGLARAAGGAEAGVVVGNKRYTPALGVVGGGVGKRQTRVRSGGEGVGEEGMQGRMRRVWAAAVVSAPPPPPSPPPAAPAAAAGAAQKPRPPLHAAPDASSNAHAATPPAPAHPRP